MQAFPIKMSPHMSRLPLGAGGAVEGKAHKIWRKIGDNIIGENVRLDSRREVWGRIMVGSIGGWENFSLQLTCKAG